MLVQLTLYCIGCHWVLRLCSRWLRKPKGTQRTQGQGVSRFVRKMHAAGIRHHMILLMENILYHLIGSSSRYLQGFLHPRWQDFFDQRYQYQIMFQANQNSNIDMSSAVPFVGGHKWLTKRNNKSKWKGMPVHDDAPRWILTQVTSWLWIIHENIGI